MHKLRDHKVGEQQDHDIEDSAQHTRQDNDDNTPALFRATQIWKSHDQQW